MVDHISYKTKITNVADDGSVTMKAKIVGITLKVIGDSAAVIFSTIDPSINKSDRSDEYSQVFQFLNDTPFTATVSPKGRVTSISGKILEKIQKVKNLIPDNKVNGKSIKFFTREILSKSYLKNALSVGWIHRKAGDIQEGAIQKEVVETPPIPGDAHADPASLKPVKNKLKKGSSPETYLIKSRAGFGKHLDLGQAAVEALAGTNMVKSAGMKIQEIENGAIETSFNMRYTRKKPSTTRY